MEHSNELIQKCFDKHNRVLLDSNGKEISWDALSLMYNFKSGEALRKWFGRYRKATDTKISEQIEDNSDSKTEPDVEFKDGEEEKVFVTVEDCGDYYIISSKKRTIHVTKDKVKQLKLLYCDDNPLTINELCRNLDIPRRDFMLIKNAFNITHDDVPYLDEELNGDIDSLVTESLERKKEKYFIKLQQQEYDFLKNEIKRYRQNDYVYDKVIKALSEVKIDIPAYTCREYKASHREALLDISDIHFGLKAENYWNKYSIEVAKKRIEMLTDEVIDIGIENNISTLHVSNLGDALSGQIHDVIKLSNEINIIEQVKQVTEILAKMLITFSQVFDKVVYADVDGNHGRVVSQKDASLEKENFERFISWGLRLFLKDVDGIEFEENYYDDGIIVKNICGNTIFETHGHQDSFKSIASDLTMMLEKPTEIHSGHLHHFMAEEFHEVDVFISPSFCGVEEYSKGKRLTAKPVQNMFIYENGKRKYIASIYLN